MAKSRVQVGDRVRVGGGYDMDPHWLRGSEGYDGTVDRFIAGQNDTPGLVVRLDHPIELDGVTGSMLVLQLRYEGARWDDGETVHVEFCDFEPDDKRWADRRMGKWVESHATIKKLEPA